MFRYKHDIKQIHFNELKRKVVARFGEELVNTHHTALLSHDIQIRTNRELSSSTLTRMFVSSSYTNIPYLNTLDVLTDYAVGKTWAQFCSQESVLTENNIAGVSHLKLLEICFQNENFKTVLDYLKYLPGDYDEVDFDIRYKLSNLFGVSVRNTSQRLALTKEFSKTRQGRFLFYENFVDIDNLTGYYGESLDFYEKYGQSVDPKRKLNDHIFLNCIRFWRAWLLQDVKALKKIGYPLFTNFQPIQIVGENGVSFYPLARWHAYRLIYLQEAKLLTQNIVEETILAVEQIIIPFDPNKTVIVLAKLFEALLITDYSKLIYPLYVKYRYKIELGEVNNDTFLPLLHFVKLALGKENKFHLSKSILLPKLQLDLLTNRATYAHLSK